jgi:hypothetical protein
MNRNQFYCLYCQKAVVGTNVRDGYISNRRRRRIPVEKAKCPKCKGKLCKIVG